jgi:hypothetical protein
MSKIYKIWLGKYNGYRENYNNMRNKENLR